MRVTVLGENLKRALSTTNRAVAGKSTLPVLSNVLLQTHEGALKLSATNLETYISTSCGAKVADEGAITLPAKLLSDWVAGVPNDTIEMTLDEQNMTVALVCGKYKATMHGIEAGEFPTAPAITSAPLATFAPDELRVAIAQTALAAKTDSTGGALVGVNIQFNTNKASATFAAADGFRLGTRRIDLNNIPLDAEMLIPATALIALSGLIGENNIDVSVSDNNGQALFDLDGTQFTTRLLDGKFPDFQRIIPAQCTGRAILETADLLRALKLASAVLASQSKETQTVKLAFASNEVAITAIAPEIANNDTVLECAFSGVDVSILLNVHYLMDMVSACKAPQVAIELQTSNHPAVIKPVGTDNYLAIVMPLNKR
jgi:DNA polymerase III subunit beta